ncbi:transposase IS4 family protein [Burkholderia ambifaria MEX-5]|uniref:Transposase IS4 family protein n=2 Tax=Burkholderia ambifaria TaxID=152480 RepID=B1TDE3_9BURK|nr:transposase IS4 family protein [Burkholderia ambifaria MEX-5]
MMGLILYGLMQGVHSLRELERLARMDLRCMWVAGGITPDHANANIGRFIVLHEDALTLEFFEALTRAILKASGSSSARLAGDGTVIEAVCSRYNLLKQEAARDRAQAAEAALEHAPTDGAAQRAKQRASQCQEICDARLGARQDKGKGTESLRINSTEPEAMVQRLKRRQGYGASYKLSVLANGDRIVTAFALDASSETRVVASMLDQSARVTGAQAEEVLLDAGYFDDEVIRATLALGVSLLCPPGQWPSGQMEGGLFHKSAFDYDELTDSYRCPAGPTLHLEAKARRTQNTREHRVYGAYTCGDCHLRENCTKAVHGWRIKRYPEDEQREALRVVMQHPQARRIFSQRKAIVEPVFSSLRGQQGLNRFRRHGLAAAKREFALHAMAHNLSRAVALQTALLAVQWATLLVLSKFGVNSTRSTSRRASALQPHALGLPHDAFCDSL